MRHAHGLITLLLALLLLVRSSEPFPLLQWKNEVHKPNYAEVSKLLASLPFYPSEGLIPKGPARQPRLSSSPP
ncbi:hypothetical protein Y032_0157g3169 [Ancylostoma ceylanicum]|uniref:Uncharacterized protein n=1 Tax=Ancylostoma ceylanicum TaxID=53326 RepID=A0A016SYW0_9BILA|nr:hypothetical protein Y032_0157g3169 [Ancylostoma ceylanicum]